MVLILAQKEIGNKRAEIGERLPGRTENSIKNHRNAAKTRQYCTSSRKESLQVSKMLPPARVYQELELRLNS